MHLTDSEATDPGLTPGSVPATFEHGEIRFGFAACFDLYFPEHFEALAAQDVDVVPCTSYQRSESADRIRGIAQVRALDTGAYPLRGSYAMGQPDTGAHSLVAAADGAVLNDAGAGACLLARFQISGLFGDPLVSSSCARSGQGGAGAAGVRGRKVLYWRVVTKIERVYLEY